MFPTAIPPDGIDTTPLELGENGGNRARAMAIEVDIGVVQILQVLDDQAVIGL